MPTEQQLNELVAELADEELLARLRSGALTELAEEVIRHEIAARGLPMQPDPIALSQPGAASARAVAISRSVIDFFLTRVLRFPINAVLGREPLWAVVVFGGLVVVFVYAASTLGLFRLVLTKPISRHALASSYVLLSLYALAAVWFGVALWRTAGREKLAIWKIPARIFAVLVALNCVAGSIAAARFIQDNLRPVSDGPSLMDTAP